VKPLKTQEALGVWLRERRIREDLARPELGYEQAWFRFRWGRWQVPLVPLIGLRNALLVHDVHHLLTGYGTEFRDEPRLAAWELGNGGCRWNVGFWLDRLFAVAIGLVMTPVELYRAFRRGLECKNLYGRSMSAVLAEDVEDVRRELGCDGASWRRPVGSGTISTVMTDPGAQSTSRRAADEPASQRSAVTQGP
jgi:hypothetical protein